MVEYLGHNISAAGMSPHEAKVAAIREMRRPTNVSELRSVLGFVNYHRCYVPEFSAIAQPLNALLGKGVEWAWDLPQQVAFDTLKAALCEEGKVVRQIDPTRKLLLHTDWSMPYARHQWGAGAEG